MAVIKKLSVKGTEYDIHAAYAEKAISLESGLGEKSLQSVPNLDGSDGSSTGNTVYKDASGNTVLNWNTDNYQYMIDDITAAGGSFTNPVPIGATGYYAQSIGGKTSAQGRRSRSEGTSTVAIGDYSHSEGNTTIAYGDNSHTEGMTTLALGEYSHAKGRNTVAAGKASYAEGGNYPADGEGTTQLDPFNRTFNGKTITVRGPRAEGVSSHAEGLQTVAWGHGSHSEGYQSQAKGPYSHAENNSIASGNSSHAEGSGTSATGNYSHAEGVNSIAYEEAAHAEGYATHANGNYGSHAEGYSTVASSDASHAEGWATEVTYDSNGHGAHAEGFGTKAKKQAAHAEGKNTVASGWAAHAEGQGTLASGNRSHAEGENTVASGAYSHAGGLGTIAKGEAQTVVGKYNKEDNSALFIVGTGASASARSNALVVGSSGATIAGTLDVKSNATIDGILEVKNNTTINGHFSAYNITANGGLKVTGDTTIDRKIYTKDFVVPTASDTVNLKYPCVMNGQHQQFVISNQSTGLNINTGDKIKLKLSLDLSMWVLQNAESSFINLNTTERVFTLFDSELVVGKLGAPDLNIGVNGVIGGYSIMEPETEMVHGITVSNITFSADLSMIINASIFVNDYFTVCTGITDNGTEDVPETLLPLLKIEVTPLIRLSSNQPAPPSQLPNHIVLSDKTVNTFNFTWQNTNTTDSSASNTLYFTSGFAGILQFSLTAKDGRGDWYDNITYQTSNEVVILDPLAIGYETFEATYQDNPQKVTLKLNHYNRSLQITVNDIPESYIIEYTLKIIPYTLL